MFKLLIKIMIVNIVLFIVLITNFPKKLMLITKFYSQKYSSSFNEKVASNYIKY